jgi:hypothetical protein
MRSRTALASLLTAAAIVFSVVATATPATAGVLDVTCLPPSSQHTTYTPPLTNTAGPVTVSTSTQYGPCTSTEPGLTTGSRSGNFNYSSFSCMNLLTWNTGQQSTISGSTTVNTAGGVITVIVTGNVTAGLFAGDSVVQTATGASTDITLCTLGRGSVSSTNSLLTLEITSVS